MGYKSKFSPKVDGNRANFIKFKRVSKRAVLLGKPWLQPGSTRNVVCGTDENKNRSEPVLSQMLDMR